MQLNTKFKMPVFEKQLSTEHECTKYGHNTACDQDVSLKLPP